MLARNKMYYYWPNNTLSMYVSIIYGFFIFQLVDEQLRLELEALQSALDRDKARKGKKGKKAGKKGRRGGKKSKEKKEKDLTPDRTTESLFEELVTNGMLMNVK